jgi:SAM-dependent methyltransferase
MADDATERAVSAHYSGRALLKRVISALLAAGIDPAEVTVEQLAPLDNFHSFGVAGTLEMVRVTQVEATDRVLDVGGGIGGPARLLAHRIGCVVTVLDLSPDFCALGETMTAWTHLTEKVTFVCGSALQTPFPDASFDVVWTQHAAMSIANKPQFYAEVHRVLRPGGRFALFDVVAGPNAPVMFPVPWADGPETSFLLPPSEIRALVTSAGFRERIWAEGAEVAQRFSQPLVPAGAPDKLNPDLIDNVWMGALGPERLRNVQRNLQVGSITLALGVFERV